MSLRNALCCGVIALIWAVCVRTNAEAPVRLAADLRFDSEFAPATTEKSGSVSSPASPDSRPLLGRWPLRSPGDKKPSAGTSNSGHVPTTTAGASDASTSATPYLSELNQKRLQARLQRIEKARTTLLQRTSGTHSGTTVAPPDPTPRPLIPAPTGPVASQQPPMAFQAPPADMSLNFPIPPIEPTARPANEPTHEIVIDVPSEDGPPQGKGSLLNRHRK